MLLQLLSLIRPVWKRAIQIDIRFTERVLREHLSVGVCASFPFGFEDGVWY